MIVGLLFALFNKVQENLHINVNIFLYKFPTSVADNSQTNMEYLYSNFHLIQDKFA